METIPKINPSGDNIMRPIAKYICYDQENHSTLNIYIYKNGLGYYVQTEEYDDINDVEHRQYNFNRKKLRRFISINKTSMVKLFRDRTKINVKSSLLMKS